MIKEKSEKLKTNSRKRIAIIYSGAKYPGGIERYLRLLFDNYDKTKVELILFSLGHWPLSEELKKSGHRVVLFSGNRFRIRTIFDIASYVHQNRIDLLSGGGSVASAYARAASLLAGKSCVIAVHSVLAFDYPNSALRYVYMFLNFVSRWKTKKYIAVSNFIKKELTNGGVASRKVKVVYNGVAEVKSLAKKREKEIVIGTIGRLHHIKGYHRLVDAIEILKDEPIKVHIWGEGEDRELIENMIKVKDLSDKIELKCFADNIENALKEMDIFVQPSRMEGFGLTVVEAMMAEKPVLVTPGGSLSEIVRDGETGVVTNGFEPQAIAAGLKVLIENNKFAEKLAKNARKEAVKNFNVKKFADETLQVFLETIK